MRNVAAHVCQVSETTRPPDEGLKFTLMYMHGGRGKVAQPPAVVKVHVREDDMPDGFWTVPQTSDLADGRLGGVHSDLGDRLEHAEDFGRAKVIVHAGPGVYEHKPLRSFCHNAERACAPTTWHTSVACEAVQKLECH